MILFKKIKTVAIIGSLVLSTLVTAQAQDPEVVVEYRQSLFNVLAWNMGGLGGMAKGEVPYDKAIAERNAKRMVDVVGMLPESFVAGTYDGKDALPDIESNAADFKAKYEDLQKQIDVLAQVAGDEAGLKGQLGKVGATCKACHDKYRAK